MPPSLGRGRVNNNNNNKDCVDRTRQALSDHRASFKRAGQMLEEACLEDLKCKRKKFAVVSSIEFQLL